MPSSPAALKSAALAAYTELKSQYPSEWFFWRCGHSFDTVVDYFTNVDSSDADNFAQLAITKYAPTSQDWWDDYGWWGIAGAKASSAGVFSFNYVAHFRTIVGQAWQEMADNAPYGWQKANQQEFKDWAPLFDGGVWNHVVDEQYHPGGPDKLGGRQNTVTNGLYLVLAQRLVLDGSLQVAPPPRPAADQEYQFLKNWFDPPAILKLTPGQALMKYYDDKAVVRERVSIFKPTDQNGQHYQDSAFRPELAWAGDQGLILGGLVDRMRIVGKASTEYPALLATARKLMAGARDYLTTQATPAGTLRPWWPNPSPGAPTDDDDYWTGPAVFMRYLLNAFRNDDLRVDLLTPAYQTFIRANAEYVVNMPNRSQSSDQVVNLTNNLAILVAAIVMLASIA